MRMTAHRPADIGMRYTDRWRRGRVRPTAPCAGTVAIGSAGAAGAPACGSGGVGGARRPRASVAVGRLRRRMTGMRACAAISAAATRRLAGIARALALSTPLLRAVRRRTPRRAAFRATGHAQRFLRHEAVDFLALDVASEQALDVTQLAGLGGTDQR